jgi:hypothetical protein
MPLKVAKYQIYKESIMNKFLEKTEMLFAAVLLLGFFLPWASIGGLISFSGYNIPEALKGVAGLAGAFSHKTTHEIPVKVYLSYLLYLIPLLSIIIIVLGFKDMKTKIISIIAGVLPFVFLIYAVIDFGNIFKAASIGVYVTLLAALGLILSAIGVIKFSKKNVS